MSAVLAFSRRAGAGKLRELQRQFDILQRGEDRDKVKGLKDETQVVIPPAGEVVLGHGGGFFVEHDEASVRRLIHAGDEVEEGRFAGAGGPMRATNSPRSTEISTWSRAVTLVWPPLEFLGEAGWLER